MTEEAAPEKAEEAAPKKTTLFQGAVPYSMPNWDETKGTAKEIKKDLVNFVGDEVVEIVTQPAKATVAIVIGRIRNGINAFLAPTVSALPCEATTKKGKVCGRSPCPYPSHIEDGE